jgi:hypothetical protein
MDAIAAHVGFTIATRADNNFFRIGLAIPERAPER